LVEAVIVATSAPRAKQAVALAVIAFCYSYARHGGVGEKADAMRPPLARHSPKAKRMEVFCSNKVIELQFLVSRTHAISSRWMRETGCACKAPLDAGLAGDEQCPIRQRMRTQEKWHPLTSWHSLPLAGASARPRGLGTCRIAARAHPRLAQAAHARGGAASKITASFEPQA
jgi:hypothetical protein